MTDQVPSPGAHADGTETPQKLDLAAIQSRVAATPPKLATIREMTPAEIGQVLTDRAALVDEVERLRGVAEAALRYRDNMRYGLPGVAAGQILDAALDALDAGGEGK